MPEPEPYVAPEEEDVFELTELADASEVEAIVSPPVETRTAASFEHLTQMMVAGYEGADNTLESLVRAMLKPMLQGWLDDNLPQIVQDAVEREVARIARRK
jgi:cell pole-organizing protein PopZ